MDIQTVRKAMEATVNLLGEIQVPMSMFDSIGVPIRNAINNMHIGLAAMGDEGKEEAEQSGNDHAG